ncbi:hypothetical protein LTR28_007169, partial [Elasticomyces elasticus]
MPISAAFETTDVGPAWPTAPPPFQPIQNQTVEPTSTGAGQGLNWRDISESVNETLKAENKTLLNENARYSNAFAKVAKEQIVIRQENQEAQESAGKWMAKFASAQKDSKALEATLKTKENELDETKELLRVAEQKVQSLDKPKGELPHAKSNKATKDRALNTANALEATLKTTEEELRGFKEKLRVAEQKVEYHDRLQDELPHAKRTIANKDRELQEVNDKLLAQQKETEIAAQTVRDMSGQIDALKVRTEDFQIQLADHSAQMKAVGEENAKLLREIDISQAQLDKLDASKAETDDSQTPLAYHHAQMKMTGEEKASVQREVDISQAQPEKLDAPKARTDDFQALLKYHRAKVEATGEEKARLEREIAFREAQPVKLDALEGTIDGLQTELVNCNAEAKAVEEETAMHKRKIESLQAQLDQQGAMIADIVEPFDEMQRRQEDLNAELDRFFGDLGGKNITIDAFKKRMAYLEASAGPTESSFVFSSASKPTGPSTSSSKPSPGGTPPTVSFPSGPGPAPVRPPILSAEWSAGGPQPEFSFSSALAPVRPSVLSSETSPSVQLMKDDTRDAVAGPSASDAVAGPSTRMSHSRHVTQGDEVPVTDGADDDDDDDDFYGTGDNSGPESIPTTTAERDVVMPNMDEEYKELSTATPPTTATNDSALPHVDEEWDELYDVTPRVTAVQDSALPYYVTPSSLTQGGTSPDLFASGNGAPGPSTPYGAIPGLFISAAAPQGIEPLDLNVDPALHSGAGSQELEPVDLNVDPALRFGAVPQAPESVDLNVDPALRSGTSVVPPASENNPSAAVPKSVSAPKSSKKEAKNSKKSADAKPSTPSILPPTGKITPAGKSKGVDLTKPIKLGENTPDEKPLSTLFQSPSTGSILAAGKSQNKSETAKVPKPAKLDKKTPGKKPVSSPFKFDQKSVNDLFTVQMKGGPLVVEKSKGVDVPEAAKLSEKTLDKKPVEAPVQFLPAGNSQSVEVSTTSGPAELSKGKTEDVLPPTGSLLPANDGQSGEILASSKPAAEMSEKKAGKQPVGGPFPTLSPDNGQNVDVAATPTSSKPEESSKMTKDK